MRPPRALALAALSTILPTSASPPAAGAPPRVAPVASYRIEAAFDDRTKTISGAETITLANRTASPLPDLVFHLYLNGFRNDRSTWMKERRNSGLPLPSSPLGWGYQEIRKVALAGGPDLTDALRFESPDDGNPADRTLAIVPLPEPLLPGRSLLIEVAFEARLPRALARTGWKDDYVLAAHWFPKLAALSENGFHRRQFHAGTEFFANFGRYDVSLTLPESLKERVGATGVLTGEAERGDGRVRLTFEAPDVHDFAWTASPRFEVHREALEDPSLPRVEIRLLLQPDHRASRDRYLRAAKAALRAYGTRYVPYPYPHLTVVDPPWGSRTEGMEYPNLVVGGSRWLRADGERQPESVTVHEVGHQFLYGLVATNEIDEAHLDEGFNSWTTFRILPGFVGSSRPVERIAGIPITLPVPVPDPDAYVQRYLDWQVASRSDATLAPSWSDLDVAGTRMNAYAKTTAVLESASRTFGKEAWDRVMKTWAERFSFRHPGSRDFLDVVSEIAGPAAAEAIRSAWSTNGTVDYGVSALTTRRLSSPEGWVGDGASRRLASGGEDPGGAWESVAVVRRRGDAAWPVTVELRFENGATIRRVWDGRSAWLRYRATGPRLVAATVDPDGACLLDVNLLDNGLTAEADPKSARSWSSRLRFWTQNLLEAFALLAAA